MKLDSFLLPKAELTRQEIPILASRLAAGFPSAADDFIENKLDLNEFLIKHPAATIFAWAKGDSLIGKGIFNGDLLIIDRSIEPEHNQIVVAALDGEFTCKILDKKKCMLLAANDEYAPINIRGHEEAIIEGVIIYSIRSHI